MSTSSFAERLNIALDKEGFPPKHRGRIQLLAEMFGMSHRGASKWVSGETCPPAKKYAELAEKLHVKEAWLKTGQNPMQENDTRSRFVEDESNTVNVPVFHAEELFSEKRQPIQTVSCNLSAEGLLFAVKLETEAMSPRFPRGTVAIFDNKKPPQDGDFVLVNYEGYPTPVFRQLLDTGSALYLHAHNPKFDRLFLTNQTQVMGTMVQAVLVFV